MNTGKLGEYAFLACVIIAVIAGLVAGAGLLTTTAVWVTLVLVVLGVVVGFLNISEKETTAFLIAAIALTVANNAAAWITIPVISTYIIGVLGFIAAFVAPAAVIVAIKAVWSLAKK
jgi:hypothetical protein